MSEERSLNFIEEIVEEDIREGLHGGRVLTRFPPEPNGYLHIGHAKSICLNFGLAKQYGGQTNLRFDDTNPVKEDVEYVDSIKEDVRWLGFEWGRELYASDYFDLLYAFAMTLIREGLAYVDDSTPEEIAAQKGTPTQPGVGNEYRNRSIEENLRLFEEMKDGKYPDGAKVLRAKVDLASPNMHMRDPIMYRIKHAHHHRTGDKWCIYRCMILLTGSRMLLRRLPILSVRWNLFRTDLCMTGLLISWRYSHPNNMSLPALT